MTDRRTAHHALLSAGTAGVVPVALIHTGVSGEQPHLRDPVIRDAVTLIDMYDLPEADLGRYAALIIGSNVDQELLYRERQVVRDFLDAGRVLVFSGHLLRPWLPGAGTFIPRTIRSYHDYRIQIVKPHPIFAGISEDDLTFRRGVAGFFARGHNPPPAGAEVLLTLPDGEPVVYIDRVSTRGVILAHSGNDLLGFGAGVMRNDGEPDTVNRLGRQLFAWIRREGVRI